jgi:hypothetical protein
MPPDNYRILSVLIEGLNLSFVERFAELGVCRCIFSYPCNSKRVIDAQLRIVILVHGYRYSI